MEAISTFTDSHHEPFKAMMLEEDCSLRVVKMSMSRTKQEEIDRNLEFFLKKLPEFLETQSGKFALIRNQEVFGFYETVIDAQAVGESLFPDGLFSVQKVTDSSIDLGFFSHAMHLGAA
jgi:hypothetical protein